MKIFIACSSRNHYEEITKDIAFLLAQRGHDLVFGASSTGMMGKTLEAFSKQNRKITSVTVDRYVEDLKNIPSTKEVICETTFERLKTLYQEADVILVLPGGSGTVSELFSILEEVRTIEQKNKLWIYDVPYQNESYYDFFEALLNRFIKDDYNDESIKDYYKIIHSKEELLERIGEIE